MNIGVYLTTAVPPGREQGEIIDSSLEYARLAEELNYESVWVLEHHFTKYGICSSPLIMAAFILGGTRRLKVGTAISILTIEHPVRIAEQAALLDQLSKGRFLFGIGRGLFNRDFDVFGGNLRRSRETMRVWLSIIQDAWRKGRCCGTSDLLKFDSVPVYPEPFTFNGPPTYTAAMSPATVEWAASIGIPMLIQHDVEDEEKIANLELYRSVATEHGYDPESIDHSLSFVVGVDNNGVAIRERARYYLGWWMEEAQRDTKIMDVIEEQKLSDYDWHYRKWKEAVRKGETGTSVRADKILRLNPIGTPDECIEKLARTIKATGISRIICGFEAAGEKRDVLKSMELFERQVRPYLPTQ
jgi:alkanal monooxygenase alpha chain